MSEREALFRARVDAVRERVDLAALIGAVVKLGRGRNPRGQCPFHGSKSDSLAVMAAPQRGAPFARCWGCGWRGDAIRFVMDYHRLPFLDALARLEQAEGLEGLQAAPVRRERRPVRTTSRELVDSATMGRTIWQAGKPDLDAVRTYLRARGVPAAMLGDERLGDVRFTAQAPLVPWAVGGSPERAPKAPAMAVLIRRPVVVEGGRPWQPIGVHVTFLAPDLAGKMERRRGDGSLYPARKMCGSAIGGCAVLGRFTADAPLWAGEGIETVLSGMALSGAPADACGLAMLSLDNLTGHILKGRDGAWPLYDIRPDPQAAPALAFAHDGPVVGLIDADMKPLRGLRDRQTGGWLGEPVIEERRGRVVRRAISPAERARVAAELFVKSWRAAGVRRVSAVRPPMGMDFNDLGRAA